ncbi:MAG TPA: hypothetical protein VGI99_08545, partial [Gemmataceae bacterium]
TIVVACPLNDPSQLPTLIGALYDAASTTVDVELAPRININTAPKEVLMALIAMSGSSAASSAGATTATTTTGSSTTTAAVASLTAVAGAAGLQESDIDNIIAQRDGLNPSDPATTSGAWVIGAGISPTVFAAIEKYISGRTMVYRVHSMGYFTQGGPVARVEAVIDTNQGAPRILYFRDLTDLDVPRGFTPPPPQ